MSPGSLFGQYWADLKIRQTANKSNSYTIFDKWYVNVGVSSPAAGRVLLRQMLDIWYVIQDMKYKMTCRSSRQQTSWTLGSSSSRWREKETWASSRLFRNLGEINMILMVVVMFRIRPILRQNWSQGWLWQHWCVWWAIGQATCYERAAEYQLVRLQLSLWLSATPSPWKSARCLPEDFTIQSAMSPISCSMVTRIFYHPVGKIIHIALVGWN